MDLSTGINPFAYPFEAPDQAAWTRLPEPDQLDALGVAAASAYRAGPDAAVVVGAGSQALIQAIPAALPDVSSVGVIGFGYREHERVWQAAGVRVTTLTWPLDSADCQLPDVVIVTNPNNPDGQRFKRDELLRLSRRLAERSGCLVVDEAFADTDERESVVASAGERGLLVLRSLGKFYGLAGIRIGFGLTDRELGARLRELLGPWPVAGPAVAVAHQALADRTWRERTQARLRHAAHDQRETLLRYRLEWVGGTTLFTLVSTPNAAKVYQGLAEQWIAVRQFDVRPTWLRIGLPGDAAERSRLDRALAKICA